MSYLNGISSASGLGSLNGYTAARLAAQSETLKKLLTEDPKLDGLGRITSSKVMPFSEVVKRYNKGISKNEIQAWVWYKRSVGVPMHGWEAYFLKEGEATKEVKVKSATLLYDERMAEIRMAYPGEVLGKWIRDEESKAGTNYYIVRSGSGLFKVKSDDCSLIKGEATSNQKELNRLVEEGALFYHGGELLPLPIYTFGNMYDRELQLEADKAFIIETWGEAIYQKHLKEISEAKPQLMTVTNPDEKERPIITAISDFASSKDTFNITQVREEYMDVESASEFKKVNGRIARKNAKESINLQFDGERKYTLQHVFIKWLYTLQETDFVKSSAIDISDYYLLNRPLRDDRLSKEEKAELKANAREEGEKLFSKFLHEVLTFEDQQRLDYSWNRLYNAQADIMHHKVPVGFECSRKFKSGVLQITDIQREGVAFMEAMGSGINAFDVGVGKTMTAITNLAHALYSGKCSRPLIVVPKPTYKKWIAELIGYTDKKSGEFVPGVLSYTVVQLNDWYNLGTQVVKGLNLSKPVPKKSITIVTYEGFKRLGFGQDVSESLFTELVNILGQSSEKSERDKEIKYQKFREMIGVGLKNTVADVDALAFDYVVIDEAHRCKNVFASVKADEDNGKRYSIQSAVSETGQKAFLILNYIQRKYGRNTMLLTATPFTNSPLEIYSMLSLVGYESLVSSGIYNIDTFFDLFVLPTIEWTANYKEEIVEKEVIKSFTNRRVLQKLIYNHILYKTGEEAGVKRPKKINLPMIYNLLEDKPEQRLPVKDQALTYINMTPFQRENQNKIVSLAKKSTEGKLDMGNLFRALAYSLDNALSPYLLGGQPEDYREFVKNSPKIAYVMECIASVKDYHKKRGEEVSGQVIYMNRGKQFFPMIKEYLEEELGFKRGVTYSKVKVDEVEIISSDINDTRKENVKEAFLEGVVKVIIGTATIREGIDLQKRGTVIYNCYPEWNPTDIRQLEGRIWRQGNQFEYVRVVMPLIQDSMDVFVFQKLEEKTARINDIWFRGDRGNVLDLESLDPQEVKLALITDIDRLVRMFFDQEKEELQRQWKRIRHSISLIEEIKRDIQYYRSYREKSIEALRAFLASLKNSHWLSEDQEEKGEASKVRKKAVQLHDDLEELLSATEMGDKEIIAMGRKIDASYSMLGVYFSNKWYLEYLKEYVSKVRKTEKTVLKSKGFSIDSDLDMVLATYTKEQDALTTQADRYKGGKESPRWSELRSEIQEKKSALQVEGKTARERAAEFARLNYLLDYKVELPSRTEPEEEAEFEIIDEEDSTLELEALALELELELLAI
ncbi:SNF2-related protein [Croceimicrobium hydrocarbonivorans]|uniref:SNF2 family helicase n=1 Tax=Croceimicrobium hydrocarbonivorans TaxID=2761580 RepID=A0A7H0VBT7_9FLAO|nr:DEAD/DEAH box helicase [Croceimicrobium hydrocarbonivorans]QNR23185.1 SNF2 family helicase [Croceimicrobium hydrocarbonivorans]